MRPQHAPVALELAARKCGTNAGELTQRGMHPSTASGVLCHLVATGKLFRVPGTSVQCHQYFVSRAHADAWMRTAMDKRPNARVRWEKQPAKAKLKRRDPDLSMPSPWSQKDRPVLDGVGGRFAVPAGFVGELGALKPGQYATEPGCCAAAATGRRDA